MYRLVRDYIDLLLGSIDPKRDVDPYIWLVDTLPKVDASKDQNFQNVFGRYWQLNQSRLSTNFLVSYRIARGLKARHEDLRRGDRPETLRDSDS